MSKAEFGAAIGAAAGLDELQKQRLNSLESQVGTVDVVALDQRVTIHDVEINELQARPSGGGSNGSTFSILSAGVADLNFVANPDTISITPTPSYQTVFDAETSPLTITSIPSGTASTDFDFTSTQNKEFTARLTIYNSATTLYSLEKDIPAGESSIVMSGVFGQKSFTSGDRLKFKLEIKSPHAQTISFYPATEGGQKNLHVHTPIVIDTINSAVQTALNLKQNITDAALITTSKTIVGAINEVRNRANQTGTQIASTVVQATIAPTNTAITNNDTQEVINNKLQGQVNAKANDNAVVHLSGPETITGNKTLSGTVTLSSLTASQRVELDANKNIISVAKGTADNKNYTDTATDIKMNGTQSLGTLDRLARADHVHPSDTTKTNTLDFRQESTLFVEQTYGLDTNAGTTPNKPFKTVAKAWTDINSSGQVKVMGSATYNETHTFASTKTSIKTVLDQGAKITGTINLVAGNTSMYFNGGMFGATLNDASTGTVYFENVNIGVATLKFTAGGYKVIRSSSSVPTKIELTGAGGILLLENISGGEVHIDIGAGWVVYVIGVQLKIGINNGSTIGDLLCNSVISTQAALNAITAITNNTANGFYVLNFDNPAITGMTLAKGDIIYKVGATHSKTYTFQSAPASINVVGASATQRITVCKGNTEWVAITAIDASKVSVSGTFTPNNSTIVPGDSVKSALEKTQGQINNLAFSNISVASPIYGDSIIFENMANAIAAPAVFSQAAGSTNQIFNGATILATSSGFNNTAGVGGHTITVPAGFNQILVRVIGDRECSIELDKFNGVSWTTVGRRQHYRANGISRIPSPTGGFAKFTINRDFHVAWLPLYCPDSLGGTYMIRFTNNNPSPVIASSSGGDGRWMSGFAITKNNKGFAYTQSIEVHWRSHGNVTPLLNGATWGNHPTYGGYDGNSFIYFNQATNSFCDFPLPQIPNGKDKLFWMILYGGAEYSAPKSLRVNNQEVATSSFNGGENFIQWLEMQKASVVDIYKNLNFSNCGLIGCKVPAAIMGNNVYSHCRLDWTGAGSVSYFSDIGTLDLI